MSLHRILLAISCMSISALSACLFGDYTLPTLDPNAMPIGGAGGSGGAWQTWSSSGSAGAAGATGGAGGQVDTSSSSSSSSGDSSSSSSSGGGTGTGGAGGASPLPFCDANDPTLLACFRFDGDFNDESGKPSVVTPTNVSFGTGKYDKSAEFQSALDSRLDIANDAYWIVTEFTIEAWVALRSYPVSPARMVLFDSGSRFLLFVYPTDMVTCRSSNLDVSWSGITLDTWTHVACRQSGDVLRLYINGTLVAEGAGAATPASTTESNVIGGNSPSGDPLDGWIDNFRVWNVPRTDMQICEAAGKQGC